MITIKAMKPAKSKKESLFVSFDFNMTLVEKMKSLPLEVRKYIPADRTWQVNLNQLDILINLFDGYDIRIIGSSQLDCDVEKVPPKLELETYNIKNFEFKTKPLDHQVEGLNYALEHPKFIMGDEQGLGKSKQSIDSAVIRKDQMKHCLVVCCVAGTRWNFLKEVEKHSNEKGHILGSRINSKGRLVDGSVKERIADLSKDLDSFFLITNIETFRDKDFAKKVEELTKNGVIGLTIADEIHKCKNPTSLQGKALHSIKSYYKIPMTGTILMNSPLDLYQPLKWIGEENGSFYSFKNRYCIMGGFGGHEIVAYKNLSELQARLDKVMLRRKKEDVLDLPPKVWSNEFVDMGPKQTLIYKEVLASIKKNIDKIVLNPNPLAQLIRLRQATGAPEIISSMVNESAKLDRLVELVDEAFENKRKLIIYSNWDEVIKIAAERLKKYNPLIITGSNPKRKENRQPIIDTFQEDTSYEYPVIMGTLDALGTGFTITAAETVIFIDKPWTRAAMEQGEDRGHRIGTTKTLNIISLITKDTIDERIEEIIEEKADLTAALVDGNISKLRKVSLLEKLLN